MYTIYEICVIFTKSTFNVRSYIFGKRSAARQGPCSSGQIAKDKYKLSAKVGGAPSGPRLMQCVPQQSMPKHMRLVTQESSICTSRGRNSKGAVFSIVVCALTGPAYVRRPHARLSAHGIQPKDHECDSPSDRVECPLMPIVFVWKITP